MSAQDEYESAAEWCAAQGIKGRFRDPLPTLLSRECLEAINADPEAFEARVRDYAYANAMNKLDLPEEPDARLLPARNELERESGRRKGD